MSKSVNEFSDDHSESSEQPLGRTELLAMLARTATRPNYLAANTISRFNPTLGNLPLMDIADILDIQISRVQKGDVGRMEETLATQAIVLDTLLIRWRLKLYKHPGWTCKSWFLKWPCNRSDSVA